MTDLVTLLVTLLVAVVAGAIASVAGFGIGSILTPWLAVQIGVKLAVAAISIPHFIGTALRFWMLRVHVDRHVLLTFGLTSAAGGLAGALLHSFSGSNVLRVVFAALLMFAGLAGVTGWSSRMRFRGVSAWLAGGFSGFFGGMVGNQGGIRAAALMGFDVSRRAFVATATAVALLVDLARMPVYFATEGSAMLGEWRTIAIATLGVVLGTIGGRRVLERIPDPIFRRIVSGIILLLGVWMMFGARPG